MSTCEKWLWCTLPPYHHYPHPIIDIWTLQYHLLILFHKFPAMGMEVNRVSTIFLIAKQIYKSKDPKISLNTQDLHIYTQTDNGTTKKKMGVVGIHHTTQHHLNPWSQGLPMSSIVSRIHHLIVKDETISRVSIWKKLNMIYFQLKEANHHSLKN